VPALSFGSRRIRPNEPRRRASCAHLRVRNGAIGLVFTRFAEMQSIRQVFLSLRGDQIELPYINSKSSGQHQLLWKLPVYATVNNLLTNPVYDRGAPLRHGRKRTREFPSCRSPTIFSLWG
jgi:hypothetical protein